MVGPLLVCDDEEKLGAMSIPREEAGSVYLHLVDWTSCFISSRSSRSNLVASALVVGTGSTPILRALS